MTYDDLKKLFGNDFIAVDPARLKRVPNIFLQSPPRRATIPLKKFTPLNYQQMLNALNKHIKNNNGICPVCGKVNCPIFMKALEALSKLKDDKQIQRQILFKHSSKIDDPIATITGIKSHFNELEKDIAEQLRRWGIEYSPSIQEKVFENYLNATQELHLSINLMNKNSEPLYHYPKEEQVRLAIFGYDTPYSGKEHYSVVEIIEKYTPYVFSEGVGATMIGTVYGSIGLKNNVLDVGMTVDIANKQALKNSDFYPSNVKVYYENNLIAQKHFSIDPNKGYIYPTGHRNLGDVRLIIPEHYRGKELKVVANVQFQYNSSGLATGGEFTNIERKVTFK